MSEDVAAKIDWRTHIKAWEESGLSQNAYCQRQQLRPNQFSYWKLKLLGQSSRESTAQNLIPVQLAQPSPSTLKVTLPNGILLEGDSPTELITLIQSLRRY